MKNIKKQRLKTSCGKKLKYGTKGETPKKVTE